MADLVEIELVYALPERQELLSFRVPDTTTVCQVVRLSGIESLFPEVDFDRCLVGIFGQRIQNPEERIVSPGDRVEIYRPLMVDPKESRRRRANVMKQKKTGDFSE